MDLQCVKDVEIGLFGQMFFAGLMISSIFFLPLADTKGRRPLVIIFHGIQVVSYAIANFVVNQYSRYAMLFCLGLSMGIICNVDYMLAMELAPERHEEYIGSYMLSLDSVSMIASAIFLLFISRNTAIFQYVGFGFTVLCFVLMFIVSESPKFLHSSGRFDEAREVLLKIARVNGKQIRKEEIRFVEEF